MRTDTDPIHTRLEQLKNEIQNADEGTYYDRLREFRNYCNATPSLAFCLNQLPPISSDYSIHEWNSPAGPPGYSYRWNAINRALDRSSHIMDQIESQTTLAKQFTRRVVVALCNYLIHQLEVSSSMLYLLWRYKRWAEWFEHQRLRDVYKAQDELGLSLDVRRFLFEGGVDFPFSEVNVPRGRVDIVAGLGTSDPLVLEAKVWDSARNYGDDRLSDGLRQVVHYADELGQDRGYVVVFNLDTTPLELLNPEAADRWPARLELNNRTFYFLDVHIAELPKPISQQDKGRPVETQKVLLPELMKQ
jgi:hypothetical protein